jgi:hypothetical protein
MNVTGSCLSETRVAVQGALISRTARRLRVLRSLKRGQIKKKRSFQVLCTGVLVTQMKKRNRLSRTKL